jgi:transposase-like protein
MPKGRNRESKCELLAIHVASGGSVASFARDHGIHVRTAYAWTKDAGFDAKVIAARAAVLDKLVGRLAKLGSRAVQQIGILSTKADSENVRLAASRAVLSDLIGLGTYAVSSKQFDELQAQVKALAEALEAKASSDANGDRK